MYFPAAGSDAIIRDGQIARARIPVKRQPAPMDSGSPGTRDLKNNYYL